MNPFRSRRRLSVSRPAPLRHPEAPAPEEPDAGAGGLKKIRAILISDRLARGLIAVGLALRAVDYARNRSLWFDEAVYALHMASGSFADYLMPGGARTWPIGYAALERLLILGLGTGEYALRAVPFLSGVASLLLIFLVARRILARGAVPIAVGLFALSVPLIYYSSEFKPYSFDVAMTLLLVLLALGAVNARWTGRRVGLYAMGGAACIWLSHAAAFVLGGVAVTLLLAGTRQGGKRRLVRVGLVLGAWCLSMFLYYALCIAPLAAYAPLREMWGGGFMPFPPHSIREAIWPATRFYRFLRHPTGLLFPAVGGVAFLIGCIALARRSAKRFGFLCMPVVLVFIASALGKYPIKGRTVLFLTPLVLLIIAEGAAWTLERSRGPALVGAIAGVVLLFGQVFHPAHSAFWQLLVPEARERPHPRAHIRPALAYLRSHLKPGDIIYVHRSVWPVFDYYAGRYGLARPGRRDEWGPYYYVAGTREQSGYKLDLPKLYGHERVWVLLSRVWEWNRIQEEHDALVGELERRGKRLDQLLRPGVRLYLYDLRSSGGFPTEQNQRSTPGSQPASGDAAGIRHSRSYSLSRLRSTRKPDASIRRRSWLRAMTHFASDCSSRSRS